MKFGAKLAAGAAALACMLGAAQASQAAVIDWTLSNGTFDDGGTFSGTFSFDTVTDAITNWNVTTTGTIGTTYSPTFDAGGGFFPTYNNAYDNGTGPTFTQGVFIGGIGFDLTNIALGTPGVVSHLSGAETSYIFIYPLGGHTVTDGQAVGVLAAGVPEPAEWSLMILGASLAGASLRARRRALQA